jgi:hypothetical protein
MRLWVERMNGVPNAATASGPVRDRVPDFARFQRVAELMQIAQDRELASVRAEERLRVVSGPLPEASMTSAAAVEASKNGLEYHRRGDGKGWDLVRKERELVIDVAPGEEANPVLLEAEALLNLRPGLRRYEFVIRGRGDFDPARHPRPPSAEVRIVPRSTAQVFFYLSNGVEVPPEHIAEGLAPAPTAEDGTVFDLRRVTQGLFEVRSCKGHKPPPTAYVAVKYRGHWFYIDDRDAASKSTLALMLGLERLDLARQRPAGPTLTLPVGR